MSQEIEQVGMDEQAEPLDPQAVEETQDLKKIRKSIETVKTIPNGYVPVRLSTQGKFGAPEVFHIRNLNTEDLMKLGLSDQEELPLKAIDMLDGIILENDPKDPNSVSVKKFHEKEVHELILFIYESFYTDELQNLDWTPTEEDWEFLKEQYGGPDTDEFRSWERAYKNGQMKPKFSINLKTGVQYHDLPKDLKTTVRVSGRNGFTAKFGFPRYGDVMDLKYFIEAKYAAKDKEFQNIAQSIKMRRDAEDRLMKGENVNLRGIPEPTKQQKERFKEYEVEKSIFAMTAIKAYHLLEMNHVDENNPQKVYNVADLPLEKKIELAKNPNLDHSTFQHVQEMFNKLQFGIKEEITVVDPIMQKTVQRKYSFQLTDLLQAIRDQRPAEVVFSYE